MSHAHRALSCVDGSLCLSFASFIPRLQGRGWSHSRSCIVLPTYESLSFTCISSFFSDMLPFISSFLAGFWWDQKRKYSQVIQKDKKLSVHDIELQ